MSIAGFQCVPLLTEAGSRVRTRALTRARRRREVRVETDRAEIDRAAPSRGAGADGLVRGRGR
ncbi:hypothetical protein [Streptomyces yunnanensis]|uniref:Uncharacterized protein n=1 Tax=Streptomyces yunnanensis TaxID=156453 RepID=A0A9X8N774_9ACTN|nr:hypothetical protein [Streptomyces yunnanensis]SHN21165.1 hypothetical protein SAMN05216268_12428 [Streptomyces yunnanensis]